MVAGRYKRFVLSRMRESGNASILLYYGGELMREKTVTVDEQYALLWNNRASGLTDHQWYLGALHQTKYILQLDKMSLAKKRCAYSVFYSKRTTS